MTTIGQALLVIGGERLPAADGKTFAVTEPSTGQSFAEVAEAGLEDVERAVQTAHQAFENGPWPRMSATERGRILIQAAQLIRQRLEAIASVEARNAGKPIRDASGEVATVATVLEYWGGAANKIFGETVPVQDPGLAVTLREPVGVCALIIPWNFPLLIASWKIAPALACGNTIVVKPASLTPLSVLLLASILQEAGVPEGVVSVLPGSGAVVGDALASHPLVAKVSFTGSTEIGRTIMQRCAQNITRVSLELGGKAASIVFADADVERCVETSVFAVFGNAGQDCCARSRMLIQRSIYDEFLERFIRRTNSLQIGQPLDEQTEIGPLISAGQRQRSLDYIALGQNEGAQLLAGGAIPEINSCEGGYFLRPAILAPVNNQARVAQDEIFGPVVCLTPFETEEEAIRLANDTIYGLSGSIWTRDLGRAIRVVRGVRAGNLSVNSHHSVHTELPFGGYKQSGIGRESGMHAINLYTELKSVLFSQE